MVELGRLLTAMVTPMDERGEVDWAKTRDLANRLLDSGSDGLVVGATTGEGPTLSHEEKLRLWGEVKAAVGDRGAVIANTGNYSTWDSINLSREAEEVGVDALLLTVPYYNKPPQEGIYRHFKAIAEINPSAMHPLQHPWPHRHQDVSGNDHPGQPRRQHRGREGCHRRLRANGANHRRRV